MDIAEKIAEACGNGHTVSPHLEEILLSLDARIRALEPKEKAANPLDGERTDS